MLFSQVCNRSQKSIIVSLEVSSNVFNKLALDIVHSEDPASWKFQNYIGWWGPPYAKDLQDMKTRIKYYKSFISSFCEPFRTAGLKLGDDDSIPIYPGQQWSPDMPWDNRGGRVTLAGDAAHSMVPRKSRPPHGHELFREVAFPLV